MGKYLKNIMQSCSEKLFLFSQKWIYLSIWKFFHDPKTTASLPNVSVNIVSFTPQPTIAMKLNYFHHNVGYKIFNQN